MKKLRDYMYHNEIKQRAFAKQVGVTETTLSLVANGKRIPGVQLIQKIADATNWEIEPNDFFDRP